MRSAPQPARFSIGDFESCEVGPFGEVEILPVEPMAPATVEADLRGGAGAAAGELEAGCGGEEKAGLSEPYPRL